MIRLMLVGAIAGFGLPRVAFAPPDGGNVGGDLKTLESQMRALGITVQGASDTVKQLSETVGAELKNLGKITNETKGEVDKALVEVNQQKSAMKELEQAVARLQAGEGAKDKPAVSVGQQFVESESFKQAAEKFTKDGQFKGTFSQAIVTSLTTDAAGSAGAAVAPDRLAGILTPAMRRMTIRDLLMPGRTNSNLIQYVKEKSFTNNAESQTAEGETKGQSDIQLELKQAPVVTVAHFMVASKQILDDAPQVQSLIDGRLRYGLRLEEENQMLNSDGTNAELDGLINNSTAYSDQFTVSSEQSADVLRMAMLQTELADWPATGIILNPSDWARIELLKDSTGQYLFANPQSLAGPTLWGLPIVKTTAMRETKFMVGAFVPAAQVFDRQGTLVEISTEDGDNFKKNLVTIRAEQRLTLVVFRDEALVYGDFGENS